MATPKRLLDGPTEADYETLSYAAKALENQEGWVKFQPARPAVENVVRTILHGGTVSDRDLGSFLWYVADILENIDNRRSG